MGLLEKVFGKRSSKQQTLDVLSDSDLAVSENGYSFSINGIEIYLSEIKQIDVNIEDGSDIKVVSIHWASSEDNPEHFTTNSSFIVDPSVYERIKPLFEEAGKINRTTEVRYHSYPNSAFSKIYAGKLIR
jgi:hypothetical protein